MDYYNYDTTYFRGYPFMGGALPPIVNPSMMDMNMNMMQMQGINMNQSQIPWPLDFMNKSTQYLLSELANGLKDAVMDEKHDQLFYEHMIKIAPESNKKIIERIRDDEILHNKIFRKAYQMLTGMPLPINIDENVKIDFSNMTYMDMLRKSLMGELKAIESYRKLIAYTLDKIVESMIMYSLTDEIRHANLYNYLITTNINKP